MYQITLPNPSQFIAAQYQSQGTKEWISASERLPVLPNLPLRALATMVSEQAFLKNNLPSLGANGQSHNGRVGTPNAGVQNYAFEAKVPNNPHGLTDSFSNSAAKAIISRQRITPICSTSSRVSSNLAGADGLGQINNSPAPVRLGSIGATSSSITTLAPLTSSGGRNKKQLKITDLPDTRGAKTWASEQGKPLIGTTGTTAATIGTSLRSVCTTPLPRNKADYWNSATHESETGPAIGEIASNKVVSNDQQGLKAASASPAPIPVCTNPAPQIPFATFTTDASSDDGEQTAIGIQSSNRKKNQVHSDLLDEAVKQQMHEGAAVQDGRQSVERAVSTHQRGPIKYELSDFKLIRSLGQGAFAKVYLVERAVDGRRFALKSMRKEKVVQMQQVQHVHNERSLMESIRNPFLVGLEATFQDSAHLYMIIDFMRGGDLFTHLKANGYFQEHIARFYASEVAMALSYLHSENIVYRDLKPENVLIDLDGHVKLGDFGFAKIVDSNNGTTRTFCGTPSYLSPEVLLQREYTSAVDWWSFGVLLFEMLSGCSPFQDQSAPKTYHRILQGRIQWPAPRVKYFNRHAENLILSLLTFNPLQRLGCLDECEIRDHPFFAATDWKHVKKRSMRPPLDMQLPEGISEYLLNGIDSENAQRSGPRKSIEDASVGKLAAAGIYHPDMFAGF